MSLDTNDRNLRDVSRSGQNAALAILRHMTIWECLNKLSNHVQEPFPMGRDAIDLCRSIIEEKKDLISGTKIDTPEAQKSIHNFLSKLMTQVRNLFFCPEKFAK